MLARERALQSQRPAGRRLRASSTAAWVPQDAVPQDACSELHAEDTTCSRSPPDRLAPLRPGAGGAPAVPAQKKTPVSHQGFLPQVPGQRADQPSGASPPASLRGDLTRPHSGRQRARLPFTLLNQGSHAHSCEEHTSRKTISRSSPIAIRRAC